jgi:nitric oxide reductase large subunit
MPNDIIAKAASWGTLSGILLVLIVSFVFTQIHRSRNVQRNSRSRLELMIIIAFFVIGTGIGSYVF